jgi:hypothetical protein
VPRSDERVSASGPGRPPVALRTIVHYTATCKGDTSGACDELPESPRKATAHATATGHVVVETKHYILEVPE